MGAEQFYQPWPSLEEDAENFDWVEEDVSKARISFRNLNLQIFKYHIQWKYMETEINS